MTEEIKLTINGREVVTQKGTSILEAALAEGIYIPHLCHHPDLPPIGACRLCIVEIEGAENLSVRLYTLINGSFKGQSTFFTSPYCK